jgi:prepilin-type N-terminal cleavage/methylation domain-containing protein
MDKKGFSLIELLTVLAIIAILSVIAIPGYIGQKKRATRAEAYTNLQNLRLLEEQFYAENARYTTIVNGTGIGLPGWKPGPDNSLNFSYLAIPWSTCFTGTATGRNSAVQGDVFTIDCNNNRNF